MKEFLTSSRLAEASAIIVRHISIPHDHIIAAQACLGILLHLGECITRVNLQKIPLAECAAEHRVDHSRSNKAWQDAEHGIICLFDPNKSHPGIWLWMPHPALYSRNQIERHERPLPLGGTPFHYATFLGFHVLVRFLVIEHGADAAAKDGNGWTSLHSVAFSGHVEVTWALLEHDAVGTAKFFRPHIGDHNNPAACVSLLASLASWPWLCIIIILSRWQLLDVSHYYHCTTSHAHVLLQ
jgi:hypothetical protein